MHNNTLNEIKNLRMYLLKFYSKAQIEQFCEVTPYIMQSLLDKKRKVSEENQLKVLNQLKKLKSLFMDQAKNGGFENG